MNMIKTIVCLCLLLIPAVGFCHDNHNNKQSRPWGWQENYHSSQYYYDDSDNYSDNYSYGYERDSKRRGSEQHKNNKSKRYSKKKRVQSGWDVAPKIAKHAPNCRRYTLSAQGGKGSARITSIQGKNYIQVSGTKSGYVCYQGDPTLELGKLNNPNVKVTFKLEGKGKYRFHGGEKGTRYKNHWYRSYWGL
ncbi:hypothetical protein [Desulforhopalus sp. 52FAK]